MYALARGVLQDADVADAWCWLKGVERVELDHKGLQTMLRAAHGNAVTVCQPPPEF